MRVARRPVRLEELIKKRLNGGVELVGAVGFGVDGGAVGAVGAFGVASEFGAMPTAGRARPTG